MRVEWREHSIVVHREDGDPKFYGVQFAAGESRFLHHLKKHLNETEGLDLIKKRMWKDGHLMDEMQQYLRSRSKKEGIMLYNGAWQIEGAEVPWNKHGKTILLLERYP